MVLRLGGCEFSVNMKMLWVVVKRNMYDIICIWIGDDENGLFIRLMKWV